MTSKEKVIAKAGNDLLFFGKVIDPKMFTVRSPDFHKELGSHLLNVDIRRLNVIAPRGHAKTSLAGNLLPLHHVVYGHGFTGPKFVVLVSKTLGHAKDLLQYIKDILDYSEPFRKLYGYWGRHSARKWHSEDIVLKDGTRIICRSATQQLRGLKHGNQRPTLVIYDDPQDEKNTITDEALDKALNGLLKEIDPGVDAMKGRIVLIGTPIHQRGLVNVAESFDSWITLKYRSLSKENEDHGMFTPKRDEAHLYTPLWPEVWPVDRLIEKYEELASAGKASAFYSEYQTEIVGDGDQLFPESSFRYWEGELKTDQNGEAYLDITAIGSPMQMLPEPRRVAVNVFMGVDPASSTRQTADFSVIMTIAMDEKKNVYVIDYWRHRAKPMQVADAIVTQYRKYRPKKVQIETVGYQEMLRDYLRSHVEIYIPGLEVKNDPRRGKTERLESLQPEFASNKWYMRPTHSEFMDELVMFPKGKNDDTLDAAFYARKGAYRPYHDVVVGDGKRLSSSEFSRTYDWMLE